jgi:hypothetical protein
LNFVRSIERQLGEVLSMKNVVFNHQWFLYAHCSSKEVIAARPPKADASGIQIFVEEEHIFLFL